MKVELKFVIESAILLMFTIPLRLLDEMEAYYMFMGASFYPLSLAIWTIICDYREKKNKREDWEL